MTTNTILTAPLKKISKINSELLSVLIWGINAKFYQRNLDFLNTNGSSETELKKTELTCYIMKDIIEYCEFMYSAQTENNISVDSRIIEMIKDVVQNIPEEVRSMMPNKQFIQAVPRLIEKRAFDGFKNLLPLVYQGVKEVDISLSRVQLEALCLYAYDLTYEELKKRNNRFYIWNNKIRYIGTDLDQEFVDSLDGIFRSLEQGAKNWRSERLRIMAGKMLAKETERICRAVKAGQYFASTENYLIDLMSFIETSDAGFGVSAPSFDKYWDDEAEGMKILEINKRQSDEGRKWIRIFLVNGVKDNGKKKGSFKLTENEAAMIKKQLDNGVHVFIIFEDTWKNIGITNEEINDFDFAVLKIDGCPVLMGTQFEKTEDAKGVLHVVDTKAEEYYNEYLGKLLIPSNCQYIYEPTLDTKKSLVLGSSLNDLAVKGLISELQKIYSKPKQ